MILLTIFDEAEQYFKSFKRDRKSNIESNKGHQKCQEGIYHILLRVLR